MKQSWLAIVIGLAFCLALTPSMTPAQEKDIVIDGQIKAGVHKFKLDNSTLYQIEVKAKTFNPNVTLQGGFLQNTADFFKEKNTFRANYMPAKNGEYTVIITPNVFGTDIQDGMLDYTVTLKTMKLDEMPLLKKEDKITADDPRYNQAFRKTPHKAYTVKMTKGKTYIIDMVKAAGMDNKLDPYLILESPAKQVIAQDDDGGGFPNARIVIRPTADGEYRIIATGLSDISAFGASR